jgi:hypothetical protein
MNQLLVGGYRESLIASIAAIAAGGRKVFGLEVKNRAAD